ncbi:MAG: hypothetical protein AB1631_35070 [Acidobacteriota bacterium]
MAAAKGMLPLSNEELLEVLVALSGDEDEGVRAAAASTIETLKPESFIALAADTKANPDVLGFLCVWPRSTHEIVEAAIFNRSTPDKALAHVAGHTKESGLVEAIALNQQALIRLPDIIDAILANPARTPEAERRCKEVRQEFFEKQFGAQMVAQETRAREEAEKAAQEAASSTVTVSSLEDLIQLGLIEEGVDDTLVTEYEMEFGPFDEVIPEEEQLDIEQIVTEVEADMGEMLPERMPIFQRIALMSVKDRVMLAIKGTREARLILVRDPNRIVAGAVLRNPRLTDMEIEHISSIKTVPEDVLRQIGTNRAWTRSYTVIHNLVRNPRTPIAVSLGFLNRILTRDLRGLSTNKNIPDVIRTTASRMFIKRSGA